MLQNENENGNGKEAYTEAWGLWVINHRINIGYTIWINVPEWKMAYYKKEKNRGSI